MAKNEDGEFELVVGNKQLLSIVFIMMVLFGVVFSMGYFVGRNSTPEGAAATAAAKPPEVPAGRPSPDMPAQSVPAASSAPAPTAATETPLDPGQAKVAPATVPVSAGQTAQPAVSQQPPTAVETKPAAPAAPAVTAEGEPAPGQTFLQVAAVKRPEAELIVDVLKKKGFPALIAPVPNETLFRVLVGPLRDASAIGKAKSDLEVAGFRSIVRKY